LKNVLRLGPGNRVELFDGNGSSWEAEIKNVLKNQVELALIRTLPQKPPTGARVTLYQAWLKDRKMDQVIRQATELGAWKIRVFFSERSIPKPNSNRTYNRLERWNKIASEAAKQCRSNHVPAVDCMADLQTVLEDGNESLVKAFFWEKADTPLGDLPSISQSNARASVIVGPEGGFSDQEAFMAKDRGFVCVSMGPAILRAETAAVVSLAMVLYHLGGLQPPLA
jgi:16S rRNA (uracil1498-N3)-methyltransferase